MIELVTHIEVIMDPEMLNRLLGPGHNVPWRRIVEICEDFNKAARTITGQRIAKHTAECPAHRGYRMQDPEKGTAEWMALRAN